MQWWSFTIYERCKKANISDLLIKIHIKALSIYLINAKECSCRFFFLFTKERRVMSLSCIDFSRSSKQIAEIVLVRYGRVACLSDDLITITFMITLTRRVYTKIWQLSITTWVCPSQSCCLIAEQEKTILSLNLFDQVFAEGKLILVITPNLF